MTNPNYQITPSQVHRILLNQDVNVNAVNRYKGGFNISLVCSYKNAMNEFGKISEIFPKANLKLTLNTDIYTTIYIEFQSIK